jgi:hypothetical protein
VLEKRIGNPSRWNVFKMAQANDMAKTLRFDSELSTPYVIGFTLVVG